MFLLLPSMVSGELLGGDEKAAMLAEHNQKRCMADVPALTWDDDLAQAASDYADTKPGGTHSTALGAFKTYGECLQGSCPDDDPAKAMEFWYDSELPKYTESSPFSASHYTQVVWKGTTKVGCGSGPSDGLCSGGKLYVCQYLPLGNQFGKYAANVVTPTKTESQCPLEASSATASDAPASAQEHVMTHDDCQCKEACAKHGESYTWCHTSDSCGGQPADSAWDYCSPSRLYDETASPIMARSIPNMALPALAMVACALLAVGAVAVRWRAKPANHEHGRDLTRLVDAMAMEEEEEATRLE
jgi:hypothetical protein